MRTLPFYGYEAPDGRLSDQTTFECQKRVKLRALKETDFRALMARLVKLEAVRGRYNEAIHNCL